LRDNPRFRQVCVPIVPAWVYQMSWEDRTGHGRGEASSLTFVLDQPRTVYAIRLKYSYENTSLSPAFFRMYWRKTGADGFTQAERSVALRLETRPGPGWWLPTLPFLPHPIPEKEKMETVWVDDTIDQFRMHPDKQPFVFHISEIILLVPE